MDRMFLILTHLNRIDVPAGSQIRMEMYAKAKDNYAVYSFFQDALKTIVNQFDTVAIDGTAEYGHKKTATNAASKISNIGKINFTTTSTNILDVKAFSPSNSTSKARLDFHKGSNNSFLLTLTSNPGTDSAMVCTWKIDGKLDYGYFNAPIFGDVVRIDGRPNFLIDI